MSTLLTNLKRFQCADVNAAQVGDLQQNETEERKRQEQMEEVEGRHVDTDEMTESEMHMQSVTIGLDPQTVLELEKDCCDDV